MATIRFRVLAAIAIPIWVVACSDNGAPPVVDPCPLVLTDTISTWAGTGDAGFNGEGIARTDAQLYWPNDIEFTPTLGTFIVDWNNHRVRKVEDNGLVNTIVGTNGIGDGPPAPNVGKDVTPPGWPGDECDLNHPTQVLERASGKLLIVCWHNHKLREWDPTTGMETVLMGRGPGCTGDGELASSETALLNQQPHAVEAADGSLFIMDQRNQCVRKIDPSGLVSTVVGTKVCNNEPGGYEGDGGPPDMAKINQPTGPNPNPPGGGLAIDAQGRLFLADTLNHCIRRVDFAANVITTVAGNGKPGYSGDCGSPLRASLNTPLDIAFGPDERLYIADAYNHAIRAVDFKKNVITTVAGTGVRGFSGDDGPASEAQLALPYGIGFDAIGNLYIADTYNHRIRRVQLHQ